MNALIARCHFLSQAGKPFAAVLVMDDPATANALVGYVGHVIYRHYDYDSKWAIDDNWTQQQVNAYTQDLWTGWESVRAQLSPKVIIQPVCEKNSKRWSGQFFLKWAQLDDADGRGYKVAMFGDSPLQPGLDELPARQAAYQYAATHGHFYLAHTYVDSFVDAAQNAHWNTLYQAMPADCRPRVLVGEAASNAPYKDAQTTVDWLAGYEAVLQGDAYCDGFCHFGEGALFSDNKPYTANGALDAVVQWRLAH